MRENKGMIEINFSDYGNFEEILVEGNKQLILNNQDKIWIVKEGKVDVFSVEQEKGELKGSRNYLFSAEKNSLLFGIDTDKYGKNVYLVCAGLTGTRVVGYSKNAFFDKISDKKLLPKIIELVNDWIIRIAQTITREIISPKNYIGIEEIGEIVLEEDNIALSKAGIKWIKPFEGEIVCGYNDETLSTFKESFFPVSGNLWVRSKGSSKIRTYDTTGLIKEKDFIDIIEKYNIYIIELVIKNYFRKQEDEKTRINRKINRDQLFMEQALGKFSSILSPKKIEEEKIEEDPLIYACKLVGKAMKVEMKAPLKGKVDLKSIIRCSKIRSRSVLLNEDWWYSDNGPLLGFLEDSKKPVALIPITPASYMMYEINKDGILVDAAVSKTITPFAYMFYASFPGKELKIMDMLKLGLKSLWTSDIVMVLVASVLCGLIGMVTPYITGLLFDNVLPSSQRGQLMQLGMFLLVAAIANFAFQFTRSFVMIRVETRMDSSIQSAVWDRLLNLPVPFFRNYTAGDLAMRANGINEIRRQLSGATVSSMLSGVFSLFNFILMFYYSKGLALIALLLSAIAIIISYITGYITTKYQRKITQIEGKLSGLVLQLINGIIKFRISGAEKRAFYQWSDEYSKSRINKFKSSTTANIVITFNSVFPIIASMVFFGIVVMGNFKKISTGNFLAFNSAFTTFLNGMLTLLGTYISILNIFPLYERARPILEGKPEIDDDKAEPEELKGGIEISQICFRYDENGQKILNNVNVKVNPGEFVAVVGPSGSGKSTLLRILLGFEIPESGTIFYDGQDLSTINIKSVRSQLGVVLQNGKVMTGSIFSNIVGTYAHLTVDDAWEAAEMSGFAADIREMPMGMHTMVNEGGGTLSGGQRQRLLISRAIANKPRIIFFDEATSALDNRTQEIVSKSLDNLNATRLVIAHRLSTIMNADKIIVIEKGVVVQEGTYKELIDQKGPFADLAKRQLA